MSVLKTLKGTFQNVQQDIVDGFRALTSLDPTSNHAKIKQLCADGISLDAGADLLDRFHQDWSELQSYTTESAQKAEEIDSMVGKLLTHSERCWESACRLEEEASALPTIASTLKDMLAVIESLHEDFQAVEEEIDRFQDICEQEALEREQASHRSQLAAYVKTREADALVVKGKLWKMLKDKARDLKAERQMILRGQGEGVKSAGAGQSLDTHEEFSSSGEGDKAELSHGEEAFIEDDYTLDYSDAVGHHDHFPEIDDDHPINFDDATDLSSHTDKKDLHAESAGKTEMADSQTMEGTCEESPEHKDLVPSGEKVGGDTSQTLEKDASSSADA